MLAELAACPGVNVIRATCLFVFTRIVSVVSSEVLEYLADKEMGKSTLKVNTNLGRAFNDCTSDMASYMSANKSLRDKPAKSTTFTQSRFLTHEAAHVLRIQWLASWSSRRITCSSVDLLS